MSKLRELSDTTTYAAWWLRREREKEVGEEMKLFAQLVRTVVNVVALPVEIVKDIGTLGGVCTKGEFEPYTVERLKKLADDAKED